MRSLPIQQLWRNPWAAETRLDLEKAMNYTILCQSGSHRCIARVASLCLMTTLVVSISSPLQAGFVEGSYQIDIGESERLLEAQLRYNRGEISSQQLAAIESEEMCLNPSARLQMRNRPAIKIVNTSGVENEILSLTIYLEEGGFSFGTGDVPTDGFQGSPAVLSDRSDDHVNMSSHLQANSSILTLNFSGLLPGYAAIFRIDLDPTPVVDTLFPDYRVVMLGADPGTGPTDPALVSVNFGMDEMETETEPSPFYESEDVLPYAGASEGYHSQSPSEMFGGEGGTVQPVIPEPSTAVLLTLAVLTVGTCRRGRES